jgi:hypothetical protein
MDLVSKTWFTVECKTSLKHQLFYINSKIPYMEGEKFNVTLSCQRHDVRFVISGIPGELHLSS